MSFDCDELNEASKLRDALEAGGLPPAFAAKISNALLPRVSGLQSDEIRMVIEGVLVASRIYGGAPFEKTSADPETWDRIFCDIANEIRKLDEGVRMLASYAIQIRHRVEGSPDGPLH